MQYPLFINFKKIALTAKFTVVDANGNIIWYIKQKLFKLKEDIKVYSSKDQTNLLFSIKADRILDFSANYSFLDPNNIEFGSIKRKGARSLWRAHYIITTDGGQELTLTEDSVMVRFLDGVFSGIPLIGCCSGLVFNPSYTVKRADETPLMCAKKTPSMFESKFKVEKLAELNEREELQVLLGIMMMMILERARG
ncbi:MAG: hypothetical protein DRO88_08035 [Promethearchaeia archaeon]|nr:MAG: hypothetical protein DRO88_08035 [Candidatus Lokiarchaeia archaeon]